MKQKELFGALNSHSKPSFDLSTLTPCNNPGETFRLAIFSLFTMIFMQPQAVSSLVSG